MSLSAQSTDTPPVSQPPVRLDYLDGLRGLAALYVASSHTLDLAAFNALPARTAFVLKHLLVVLTNGHAAVDIFIVLSGYCLMLPLVRGRARPAPLNVPQFVRRRARRILPPYYFALGLTLLLSAAFAPLRVPHGIAWDSTLPVTPRAVIMHILLLHNLFPAQLYRIDYPMWSVATEWQIYFLFPGLLLPIWQRWGRLPTLGAAFLVSLSLHFLFRGTLDGACFQYVGLFTLGMIAADIGFGQSAQMERCRRSPLLGRLGVLLLLPLAEMCRYRPYVPWSLAVTKDFAFGLVTVCVLVVCTRYLLAPSENARPRLLRLLEARVSLVLGAMSYSLYLIHAPLLALVQWGLRSLHITGLAGLGALYAVGLPFILAGAYLFHLAFERPFLPGRPRTERQAEAAATISPAP